MGVPHFMLESGKNSISSIVEGRNPLVFYSITDLPPVCSSADAVSSTVPVVAQDSLSKYCVNAHDHAEVHDAVDAWEREYNMTLPIAVYKDRDLFLRNVLRDRAVQAVDDHAKDTGTSHCTCHF